MVAPQKSKLFADSFILNSKNCGLKNLLQEVKITLMKIRIIHISFIYFPISNLPAW